MCNDKGGETPARKSWKGPEEKPQFRKGRTEQKGRGEGIEDGGERPTQQWKKRGLGGT